MRPPTPGPTGSRAFRALRVVSALEGISFAVLLVSSVLKRTTELDLVPVLGPVHGALFVAVVLLALGQRRRLAWSPAFMVAMLTVGSPGMHFALQAWVGSLRLSGTRST